MKEEHEGEAGGGGEGEEIKTIYS